MLRRARPLALVALVLAPAPAFGIGVAVRVNRPHPTGQEIEFAANGVGDGELSFTWDFGDGERSQASPEGVITHTYDEPGHYSVIVVVQDDTGARSDSFLQTVHRPLPPQPPVSSSTIVHDAPRRRVCNVNADSDTVTCLSTETLDRLFEVPVGTHPRSLAVSPQGELWVVNQDDATVTVLSGAGDIARVIDLPRASKPFSIVLSPLLGRAFVALRALGEVAEIDLASAEVLRRAPAIPGASGLALDATHGRLFVTRLISPPDRGELVELNATTLQIAGQIPLALDPGPDTEATARGVPNYLRAVVPNPDGSSLFVPSKKDNVLRGEARDGEALTFETSVRTIVSVVDLASGEERLEQRIDLNNRTLGLSLAFSPLGDYAFVALLGNNGIEVVDTYNQNIVAGAFDLGLAPDGVALDENGKLYVNSFLSRSVVVLDAAPILGSTDFALDVVAEVAVSTHEKLDAELLLGKQVFYNASDLRMSQDGYISCAVCHLDGFEDGQVWDFTDRGEGLRNTTSLLGKRGTGQGRLHWSGNFDEVQDFEHDIRGPFGGKGFLPDDVWSEGTRDTTLGDTKAGLSPELDALAAYVTSLDRVSPSPYRDPDGSLTEAGWRGFELFESSGCGGCHGGADYTNSSAGTLYDVGTLSAGSGKRLGEQLEGLDTPTLRGIWETAPYLHDGSAETILEVIGERNVDDLHGSTQGLTPAELQDLAAYMRQIDNSTREQEFDLEPEPAAAGGATGGGMGAAGAPGSGGSQSGGSQAGEETPSVPPSGCALGRTRAMASGGPRNTGLWLALISLLIAARTRRHRSATA